MNTLTEIPQTHDELPSFLPPLRMEYHGNQDHVSLIQSPLPHNYLMRQVGMNWFQLVEQRYPNMAFGTRILVRRVVELTRYSDIRVVHDYITTRSVHPTLFGNWVHYSVAYLSNQASPYPYDIDGFHNRNSPIPNPNPNPNPNPTPISDELSSSALLSHSE